MNWVIIGISIFIILIILIIVCLYNICVFNRTELLPSIEYFLKNKNDSNIIISFTTIPSRLKNDNLKKVIESMLRQTCRAKEIIINIPYFLKKTGTQYIIPKWLRSMEGIITINRCEDYGPATKYITILQIADPNQRIYITDDDVLLDKNTLEWHSLYGKKYPTCCLANIGVKLENLNFQRGTIYLSNNNAILNLGFKMFYIDNSKTVENLTTKIDIVLGFGGYSLIPSMINVNDVMPNNLPKEAFFVDDIVISGALAKNNVTRLVIKGPEISRMTIGDLYDYVVGYLIKSNVEILSVSNNSTHKNNNTMINYFRNYW